MKTSMKPNDYDVHEIFEEMSAIKNEDNRVEWLKTNFGGHKPLNMILWMNYSADVRTALPEGEPPYNKEEQDGPSRSNLWQYMNVLPYFIQSPTTAKVPMLKRENMFIEMLDSLANKEAELVCLAKDRRLEEKYDINLVTFEKAFKLGIRPAAQTARPAPPKTPEQIAEEFKEEAKKLKAQAKDFTAQAKEYEAKAKEVLAEAKDESAAG